MKGNAFARILVPAAGVIAAMWASVLLAQAPPVAPQAQGLPLEKMRQYIAGGVAALVAAQGADGSWSYGERGEYNVGMTALCTLALRHSGRTEAIVPAQKGLAYVAQHAPEPRTYTAGLVEALLYEAGGKSYETQMGTYAEMVIRSRIEENPLNPHMWGYGLVAPPKPGPNGPGAWGKVDHDSRGDNSNMQYAILALYFAQKAGFQVPVETWRRIKEHYETTQREDGAWCYLHPVYLKTVPNPEQRWDFCMTCVGSVSLYLADEALAAQGHGQCKMTPDNPKVMKGMEWAGQHMRTNGDGYGWYACERLGILSGRGEFAGKDWLEAGANAILRDPNSPHSGNQLANVAFQVLFLARALEPVRVNKLQRDGDWNNDPYDAKHLTEFITEKYQNPTQWRIVTLEAPVEYLLRVPILYLSGHEALKFTDAEKARLKEYVDRGGTIFAMACCGKAAFDKSFRDLCAELWPDLKLLEVAKNHPLFEYPKRSPAPPVILGMALAAGQGRLGVIYSPYDFCCRWHMGGKKAEPAYAFGVNLIYYVDLVASRQGAVIAGHGTVHTGVEAPAPATPVVEPQPVP